MKLPNIAGFITIGKAFVQANRPELLFGTSVVTTVAGMVAAARAGYKSGQQVLEAEMALAASPEPPFDTFQDYYKELVEKGPKLSNKEKAQLTWLNYLPAAGIGVTAVGATTGLHLVHVKEKKQMAAAALMAIEQVKLEAKQYGEDLKAAVEDNVKLTDKKRDAIDNSILEKQADRNNGTAFVQNSDGLVEELYLVRDAKTGRDIWSNETRIGEAVNNVNKWIAKHGDAELNTFYSAAGYDNTPDGDDWGWSGDFVELKWDTTVRDDGRPVRRFAFQTEPQAGICGS